LANDRYRVQDLPEIQRTQRFYERIVAVDQIKLFTGINAEESSGSEDNDELGETENETNQSSQDENVEKPAKLTEESSKRTTRVRKKPQYLRDYVCD